MTSADLLARNWIGQMSFLRTAEGFLRQATTQQALYCCWSALVWGKSPPRPPPSQDSNSTDIQHFNTETFSAICIKLWFCMKSSFHLNAKQAE